MRDQPFKNAQATALKVIYTDDLPGKGGMESRRSSADAVAVSLNIAAFLGLRNPATHFEHVQFDMLFIFTSDDLQSCGYVNEQSDRWLLLVKKDDLQVTLHFLGESHFHAIAIPHLLN